MKKILVFCYGNLGDILVGLPALWTFRARYPTARFTILSNESTNYDILLAKYLPSALIDEFQTYSNRDPIKIITTIMKLRRANFDGLIYLASRLIDEYYKVQRDLFFFSNLCAVPRILNHLPKISKENTIYSVENNISNHLLLTAVTPNVQSLPVNPRSDLDISIAENEMALRFWNRIGYSNNDLQRAVVIGIGAKSSPTWPLINYVLLGKRLVNDLKLLPIIFGAKEDISLGDHLIEKWGGGCNVAGMLTIRQSSALMSFMVGYIGNDTGTIHLAAASGINCIGIYSARNMPGAWDPFGSGHKILRKSVECEGCKLTICNNNLICLSAITVDEVFNAVEEIFCKSPPKLSQLTKILPGERAQVANIVAL